jgi:putative DNA primase/helicase
LEENTIVAPENNRYQGFAEVERMVSEYDLRNNVVETWLGGREGIAYSGRTFRRYRHGVWKEVDELEVSKEVAKEIEIAALMRCVRPSYNLERNVTSAIKSLVHVPTEQWDTDPNLLVFRNCALNLLDMEPLEHSPEHRATVSLPFDYDPTAPAPTWEKVIQSRLGEAERNFFQEFAGYCLTHSVKHQMALWLVGPRGGGRSTLIAGLEAMLCGLSGTLSLKSLTGSGGRFALSNIPGKTLLTSTETPVVTLRLPTCSTP